MAVSLSPAMALSGEKRSPANRPMVVRGRRGPRPGPCEARRRRSGGRRVALGAAMSPVAASARTVVAADVMSTPTVSIAPTTSVWTAWSVMMRTGLRHLVVAADDRCLGVVDDRSVFAEWPMGPLALRRRSVRDLVRPRTTCVLPTTSLQAVAQTMVDDAIDAVPVIAADGQLVGIVTGSDVARAVALFGICLEEES
jgi:CBS domain-containing protein